MNTNHDALREALAFAEEARKHGYHFDCMSPTRLVYRLQSALSQPMPEAAAQETPLDKLRHEMRLVTALTLKNPGVAITLPDLMATEGRKFMRGEPSLFDQLPFGEMQSVTAMLSASPAAPDGAKPEQDKRRCHAEGDRCHGCAHYYGKADVCVYAQPTNPRPQAQPTLSADDIHSCGEFCDRPECVAAREAQAQGDPSLPPLPEGKVVVRGPVSAFNNPESGSLVDFDCEGPLSHCPDDGEELFTADQVLSYGAECVQSHREAIAEVTRRFEELKRHGVPYQVHNEAIAKKDAALLACVEALKLAMHWAGPAMERDMRSPSNSQWMVEKTQAQEDSIYAAITHANQVLGRK